MQRATRQATVALLTRWGYGRRPAEAAVAAAAGDADVALATLWAELAGPAADEIDLDALATTTDDGQAPAQRLP